MRGGPALLCICAVGIFCSRCCIVHFSTSLLPCCSFCMSGRRKSAFKRAKLFFLFFFFLYYGLIPRKVWNASASHLCHHIPIRKPVVISAGKHAKIFLWSCDKLKESILLITCKRACDDKQNSCSRPLSLFDELLSCLPGSDLFEPETPKPRKTCSHVSVYGWVFHQEC